MTITITKRKGGKIEKLETGYDFGAAIAGPFATIFAAHYPGVLSSIMHIATSIVLYSCALTIVGTYDFGLLGGLLFVFGLTWLPAITMARDLNAWHHRKFTNGEWRIICIHDDATWEELKTIKNWRTLL